MNECYHKCIESHIINNKINLDEIKIIYLDKIKQSINNKKDKLCKDLTNDDKYKIYKNIIWYDIENLINKTANSKIEKIKEIIENLNNEILLEMNKFGHTYIKNRISLIENEQLINKCIMAEKEESIQQIKYNNIG